MPADNLAYQDEPLEAGPRILGLDESATAGKLRELQHQARLAETAAAAAKVGGTAMQAGGKGMKLAGKAAPAVGSGIGAAGGAVVGGLAGSVVPGIGTAAGATAGARTGGQIGARAGQAIGTGMQTAGEGLDRAGQTTRNVGKEIGAARKEAGFSGRLKNLQNRAKNIKQGATDLKNKLSPTAAVSQGTSWLLRWAWPAIIPTFGFSILYIDLHVFLNLVLGEQFFCKLGHEWVPKGMGPLGDEAMDKGGKIVEIVEVIGFLIVNLLFWGAIATGLTFVVIIAEFYTHPWETFVTYGWGGLKALWDLINPLS